MTENSPLGRLLADALQGSTPYGAGLMARPIASQGLSGLLGMQSFGQRMASMPQPAPAATGREMLQADFGRGIQPDDPRIDLAMALSTATPRAGIRAYHGSPHDFDRFDMSRIGTGEGANVYGRGLYFAEREGVARSYRDALSRPAIEINGQRIAPSRGTPEDIALAHLETAVGSQSGDIYGFARRSLNNALQYAPDTPTGTMRRDLQNALDVLHRWQDLGARPGNTGRMYEVNLRTDPSRLLDWDAPLAQQPRVVQEALPSLGVRPYTVDTTASGARAYVRHPGGWVTNQYPNALSLERARRIADELNAARRGSDIIPVHADQVPRFRDAGIEGIQYLDQGSRAAGQGTRNYVMFDDRLIDIIRKYGLAGVLASGAGYGAASPVAEPQNP